MYVVAVGGGRAFVGGGGAVRVHRLFARGRWRAAIVVELAQSRVVCWMEHTEERGGERWRRSEATAARES